MKRLARIYGWKIWTLLLLLGTSLGSCSEILDDEEDDCAVYVRFKYDMNMKYADAFQNAVNSVTLYAFKDGVLAYQKTEEGELLKREGYRMRLDDIPYKKKHEYDYITWAGDTDFSVDSNNKSFTVPLLKVGVSTMEDLYCQLNRAGDGIISHDLQELYHGMTYGQDVSRAASSVRKDEVLVSLTKNTNKIRIILQQMNGTGIDVEKFKFTITDDNGYMYYDNTLLDDMILTYRPYYRAGGSTAFDDDLQVEEGDNISVAVAQLTVGRLVESQHPTLTITNTETGEEVLKIALIKYLLLTEAEGHDMTNQEYLDRQDEYHMTFFLDENMAWINTRIIINDWVVRYNDMEGI